MRETTKTIYTTYDERVDMTVIFEDTTDKETGDLISTEVKGFYFGEPDEDATKAYYGKLRAEF